MMYRIDFETMREAAEILYCFMTLPLLNDPECTIWSDSGFPDTITNTGSSFMTEQEFCERITSSGFTAISCVASADKAGTRRAVLNLLPDTDYLVLNFPPLNGKINPNEKTFLFALFKMLRDTK